MDTGDDYYTEGAIVICRNIAAGENGEFVRLGRDDHLATIVSDIDTFGFPLTAAISAGVDKYVWLYLGLKNLYMSNLLRSAFLLFTAVCLSFSASAQMTVESTLTVTEYVQNVLLGDGVTISNVTMNGQPGDEINLQCGYFISNGSYMLIDTGLVLSTGEVVGVDFDGDSVIVGELTTIPVIDGVGGDPDLMDISGEDINDQAVLEFDFIPQGDTLRFNYVFGSEEYPEFVNEFNDAFGFFLSGPGISGPYSSPAGFPNGSANIALIPGSTTPVTIDNVNNGNFACPAEPPGPCMNCEFYVDNCPIEEEALDGMTTVLQAFSLVECGAVYHIKLAIGDALDGAFDSAVFLESGSFQSSPSGIVAESIFPLGLVEISDVCDSGSVFISRNCAGDSLFYHMEFLVNDSTATPGEDYEPLPSDFVLIPGQNDTTFSIITFPDGIEEDIEYICIELSEADSLDGEFTVLDTACIAILDQYQFAIDVDPWPVYCPTTIPVFPVTALPPAVQPFDVFWLTLDGDTVSDENNMNSFTTTVPPNFGDTVFYDVHAIDFCGASNFPTQTYVTNRTPGPTVASLSQPGQYCPGLDYPLQADRTGGTAPFTY